MIEINNPWCLETYWKLMEASVNGIHICHEDP